MTTKRYFELVEGTSSKFWEIWREGAQVFTRYGKIGAKGQVTVKDEGSEDKAQKLYDKLLREKTGKGYSEKGGGASEPVAAAPAKVAAPAKAAAAAPAAKAAPAKPAAAAAPVVASFSGGTRRFEMVEGSSSKFWEITLDGSTHTVRFGKIGTPGQEKTKSFGSPAQAERDAAALVGEKTKKGYAEVGGGGGDAGPPTPPLDPADLAKHFAAIDAKPDDPGAYLVFADWLLSVGHPWGNLITLQHAIATAPNAAKKAELTREETALLQAQGAAILGDLARAGRPTRFVWHYGFVREAVIASPTDKLVLAERVSTLFSLPAGRSLRKLTLHAQPARFAPHQDWDDSPGDVVAPWADVLPVLEKAPKSMTALCFGDPPPTGASAYVAPPDLGLLSRVLPRLESLEVQGSGGDGLGTFGFPELRSFELRLAATGNQDLASVAAAKLPKLERLAIWLGGQSYCVLDDIYSPEDYDGDDDDGEGGGRYPASYPATDLERLEIHDVNVQVNGAALSELLAAKWPASLVHLGLKSAHLSAELLEAICNGGLVKRLETLDLSGGTLNDEKAATLVRNKAKLAHLKELDLSRNALTEKGVAAVRGAIERARCDKQRSDGFAPEFLFRYVATME